MAVRELLARVRQLRAEGKAPKQIARIRPVGDHLRQAGRPTLSGPYDDPRQVVKTLERTVGANQFGFSLGDSM